MIRLKIKGFQYKNLRQKGECDLAVYKPKPGITVVIYAQPGGDYHGVSVTNGAENIATAVTGLPEMGDISTSRIIWIEHYPPENRRETVDLVMFSWHKGIAHSPTWIHVGRAWVEKIILDSLDPKLPDAPPDVCPICGGDLLPDVEYMQDRFGPDWRDLPWPDWSFCCESCGEAGSWAELENIAEHGYGEKP